MNYVEKIIFVQFLNKFKNKNIVSNNSIADDTGKLYLNLDKVDSHGSSEAIQGSDSHVTLPQLYLAAWVTPGISIAPPAKVSNARLTTEVAKILRNWIYLSLRLEADTLFSFCYATTFIVV